MVGDGHERTRTFRRSHGLRGKPQWRSDRLHLEEEEEPVFYEEEEEENVEDIEEPIHTLARMIMQHEREQRANALSKYDRLLGFA